MEQGATMDDEIQLVCDGEGLAVIGDPAAVERFLVSEGLESSDLGLQRLGPSLARAAGVTQAASEMAANSGRWVKLTDESVEAIKKYGLMKSKTTGLDLGVIQAKEHGGKIKGVVQFAKGSGLRPTNPALLAGAAGIMAQLAMQQTMQEITDYLATIDAKIDEVLRAQKDAVAADMLGVELVIAEAMTVREHVGRVSEVTWSKVQSTAMTIASTQAFALRQLDALTGKVDRTSRIGELAESSKEVQSKVQEWLAVLAHTFHLQEAIGVLELDRVLDATPDDLDRHRLGLQAARSSRRQTILRSTESVLARMDAAATKADTKVLLHPRPARAVVNSRNDVAAAVGSFHSRLGIEHDRQAIEGRRWSTAAVEVRDKAVHTGAEGIAAARNLGAETLGRAQEVTGRLADGIAEQTLRLRKKTRPPAVTDEVIGQDDDEGV